jgi:hypothetical protein
MISPTENYSIGDVSLNTLRTNILLSLKSRLQFGEFL